MTTTTTYADAADGYIASTHGDDSEEGFAGQYATARAGTGTLVAYTSSNDGNVGQADNGGGSFYTTYIVSETFLGFDTSSIDDGDTVSAAVLNVTSSSDQSDTDFTIQARLKDWSTTVTTADWVAGASLSGLTLLATYATSSGFTANSAYDFTSDANFPGFVSKAGTTRMLLCSSRTVGNNSPSGNEYVYIKSADTTGTTSDPKLTVTHAAGSGSQDITLGLLDASSALYAPVVDAEGNHELYAPTLTPKNTVTLGLLDGGAELYAPTVAQASGPQTVTLGLLDAGPDLYAPTLLGKNTITLGLLDASSALYAPSLAVGPVTVTLTLLDGERALYAPTLAQASGTQTITLGLLDAGPELYAPTLLGKNTITVPLLDASSALYAPTLGKRNTLTIPLLDAGAALYAPTLAVGAVTVTVQLLDGGRAVYAPTLTAESALVIPLLDASGALYAPAVVLGVGVLSGGPGPTGIAVSPIPSGITASPAPSTTAASPVPSATSASPVPSGRSSSPTPR